MDAVNGMDTASLIAAANNAKRAVKENTADKLQQSNLLYKTDLAGYVKNMMSLGDIITLRANVLRYPADFGLNVGNMKGVSFNDATNALNDVTLKEWRNTTLHKRKAAFIVGDKGAGKSTLANALGGMLALRQKRDRFLLSKAIDPCGLLSRQGQMATLAAYVFHDCELKSLIDNTLSHEAIKAMCDVNETAAIPARYHNAIFTKNRPRIFTCNLGRDNEAGDWFMRNNAPALAALARKDIDALRRMSDDDQAVARRAVVFFATCDQVGANTQKLNVELDEELAARRPKARQNVHNAWREPSLLDQLADLFVETVMKIVIFSEDLGSQP
jgi:energy-coupling factor transporter ATP-binding protein EcfA2